MLGPPVVVHDGSVLIRGGCVALIGRETRTG